VHFMIVAIGELDVRTARVNEQDNGSEQYNLRRLYPLEAVLKAV
jgi:hypothetical protein